MTDLEMLQYCKDNYPFAITNEESWKDIKMVFKDGYELGTNERETRVNKELGESLSKILKAHDKQRAEKEKLKKENTELKEKYKALELNTETRIKGCNDEIYRLKAQIEKMKCCGNCKHWICAEDYDGKSYYCEKYMETCDNLNKWELAE